MASAEVFRVFGRLTGVSILGMGSLDANADCEDIFAVAGALPRGCSRDIGGSRRLLSQIAELGYECIILFFGDRI